MSASELAIQRYNEVSRDLSSLFQERGELLSAAIDAKISGYETALSEGANVTNARHASDVAAKYFDQELAKINGNISAYEVELRYLDQLLVYERYQDARTSRDDHD